MPISVHYYFCLAALVSQCASKLEKVQFESFVALLTSSKAERIIERGGLPQKKNPFKKTLIFSL